MLKAIALGVDVLILVAVGSYFIVEGFGHNVALEIFLALIGAASLVILVGVIREGKQEPLQHKDGA